MRYLTRRIRPFDSFTRLKFQLLCYSTLSKRKTLPRKTQKKHPAVTNPKTDSLFSEITEILGSVNLAVDEVRSLQHPSDVAVMGVEGSGNRTPGVCENAQERINESVFRDAQVGKFSGNCTQSVCVNAQEMGKFSGDGSDVSEMVHKITQIVRANDSGVLMEDQLDNSSCEISSEVVCMVLKRCFKVPHLARRFFDWVKLNHGDCVTTEIYNTMLYLAGEAKKFEVVDRLLEEMESSDCEKDVKTWTILLLHYGKAKLVGKALAIFEKMKRLGFEPDGESYGLIIRLLCESRKGEIALEFYKEMVRKGIVPDVKTYRLLLTCVAGCGDIDGVYLVADDMMKVSEIPEQDVYSCVLKSLCVSERIREALELIRDLKNKNLTLSQVHFETLVKGLCKADKMDDALEIVGIMKKRNLVNEAVYGALISGYLRKNDASKALDLFYGMKEDGFMPLTSTYTELMQQLFNANEYEKGSALFDEMLEKGIKLDTVAYTAMIAGHVRNGNISAAWTLFGKMEAEGIKPTQKSYSVFIKELCRASNTGEIISVLRKMHDSRVTIGKEISHSVNSYLDRKRKFLKSEEVDEMQRYCRRYCEENEASEKGHSKGQTCTRDSDNIEPIANHLLQKPQLITNHQDLETICTILSSSKDWSLTQEALEKHQIYYTPDLVTETLKLCSHYGSAVLHFFSWVRMQPGYRHTTDTYNMAIKIAGRGKDFKHMRALFYEMKRNGCIVTSDTWTILIMSYGRVGLTDIALRNFKEMKACGFKPNASTYKYLILSLCERKGGNVEEAQKLFREMVETGIVPDKELVEGLFDCLCITGKFAEAKKCLECLCKVGPTKVLSYSLLIRALCRRGKIEEALALADEVKEERSTLDHYIYGSLIHGLLKKGQIDKALAKFDSMKLAGIKPTAHVYTSLISHFCNVKEMDRALDILKQMWEENCHPTVVTYTALIHGFLHAGNVAEARRVFLRMRLKGPFPDFRAYTVLIAGLCEVGKAEDALRVLSEMRDDGLIPSSVNFRTVFFGLNREGKRDLAQRVMQQKRATASNRKLLHG